MQTWMVLGLWLVYLALTANLEVSNLVVGLLIALGLTFLLHPDPRRVRLSQIPGAFWAAFKFALVVAWDVIAGGLQVARITLDPRLPIQPAIIAIPSGVDSELATALVADAITLSPGELVVEIGHDSVMYTHTLDVTEVPEPPQVDLALRM
jgi:multicomponent Na+:H+ antiporter subunit E